MPVYRATVVGFSAITWLASIRPDGSPSQTLDNVRTARNIASAEMTGGRRVLFDTGDHGDIADIVIFAVFTA